MPLKRLLTGVGGGITMVLSQFTGTQAIADPTAAAQLLGTEYRRIRAFSEELAQPLETEDMVIQSMPDVSPTKWHLAHVSWFFETFVLAEAGVGYASPHPRYTFLFNSYYNAVGPRHCRPRRGLISRPTVEETFAYRRHVDEAMLRLIDSADESRLEWLWPVILLGLHHEQQHQELLLTDVKHVLAQNPLRPVYRNQPDEPTLPPPEMAWIHFSGGLNSFGRSRPPHADRFSLAFAYDNEEPPHRHYLGPFALGSRLVTCGEYLEFMREGGYGNPALWLSDGWAAARAEDWQAPLYWFEEEGAWRQLTLHGECPVEPHEPVTHVSYYEADAFARWAGARLATEYEWELAVRTLPAIGNFADQRRFHPRVADSGSPARALIQAYGDVWEWTQSAYAGYPGYRPAAGAVGEYNGKFMCNQFVLRGGSCATSQSHIRPTYRNFFPPEARWQFSGIRLAKDA